MRARFKVGKLEMKSNKHVSSIDSPESETFIHKELEKRKRKRKSYRI